MPNAIAGGSDNTGYSFTINAVLLIFPKSQALYLFPLFLSQMAPYIFC
jgi:hypothetical protein